MTQLKNDIDILFVAGFGPISSTPAASRGLYADALQIPFKVEENGYLHTNELDGVHYFGVWPWGQIV